MKESLEIMATCQKEINRLITENGVKLNCSYNRTPYRLQFLDDLQDQTRENDKSTCNVSITVIPVDEEHNKYSWVINSPSGYRKYEGSCVADLDRKMEAEIAFTKAMYTCLKGDYEPDYKPLNLNY